jgi:CubicO group peptidase (beta-lactamase class C family)
VRIGEVSAVFVASAILTLDECARGVAAHSCPPAPHGPLRLDDTLEHWIPGWPGGADITIRMLLAGTSGLAPAGPTIADLLAPGAAPEGGWTRAALLARGRAQSARFAPGSSCGPVDTESLLLEEIGVRATGRPAGTWVVPANLPQNTVLAPPANLLVGTGANGPVRDLPADLVDALGAAGGIAFNASDLADLAVAALGTTLVHDAVSISEVTAVDGPSRWSLGAAGWCPCPDGPPQVVGRSGRAGAWAAAVAYDLAGRVAVGITVDREVTDEQLQALTEVIISATR